jgi:hypothetical protein
VLFCTKEVSPLFPQITCSPDYKLLDSKIRILVRAINTLGVATLWSCEGHRDMRITGSLGPMVAISAEHSSLEGLVKMFKLVGLFNRTSRETKWIFVPCGEHLKLEIERSKPLEDLQFQAIGLGIYIRRHARGKL